LKRSVSTGKREKKTGEKGGRDNKQFGFFNENLFYCCHNIGSDYGVGSLYKKNYKA
jgi:hypothetical protein